MCLNVLCRFGMILIDCTLKLFYKYYHGCLSWTWASLSVIFVKGLSYEEIWDAGWKILI